MPASPLLTLLRLRVRAYLRRQRRNLRDPRKAAFMLLVYGAMAFYIWLFTFVRTLQRGQTGRTSMIVETLPLFLFVIFMTTVINSLFEFPLTYSAAEIQFLFPAPIGRRALLCYKLFIRATASVVTSLFFSLFVYGQNTHWTQIVTGFAAFFLFSMFFATALSLMFRLKRFRAVAGLLVFAPTVIVVYGVMAGFSVQPGSGTSGIVTVLRAIQASPVYGIVSLPMQPFASLCLAPFASPEWIGGGLTALAMTAGSAAAVAGLDRDFYESAMISSKRREERLARFRQRRMAGRSWSGASRIRLPMIPRLGGFGPTLHRHLLTLVRSRSYTLTLGLLLSVGLVAGYWAQSRREAGFGPGAFIGLAMYLTLLSTRLFRFDFRSDFPLLDYLKTLPVRPLPLAAGSIAVPAIAGFALQTVPMLGYSLTTGQFPVPLEYLALLFPANVVWLAIDNAMFLRAPVPMQATGHVDPIILGRELLGMMARVVLFLLSAGLAAGAYFLTDQMTGSTAEAWAAAWAAIAICVVAVINLVAVVFKNLDLSRDRV